MNYRNKKLEKVYSNFIIPSSKANRLYYSNHRYKQFVDMLYDCLFTGYDRDLCDYMVKYVDSFSELEFNMLCDLAETNRIDAFTKMIKKITLQKV